MTVTTLPCLVCDAPLPTEAARLTADLPRDDSIAILHGGLFFRATGNYGNRIYDPFAPEDVGYLEVVICDNCVMKKAESHGIRHAIVADRRVIGEGVYAGWRATGAGAEWLAGEGCAGIPANR